MQNIDVLNILVGWLNSHLYNRYSFYPGYPGMFSQIGLLQVCLQSLGDQPALRQLLEELKMMKRWKGDGLCHFLHMCFGMFWYVIIWFEVDDCLFIYPRHVLVFKFPFEMMRPFQSLFFRLVERTNLCAEMLQTCSDGIPWLIRMMEWFSAKNWSEVQLPNQKNLQAEVILVPCMDSKTEGNYLHMPWRAQVLFCCQKQGDVLWNCKWRFQRWHFSFQQALCRKKMVLEQNPKNNCKL